MQLNYLKCWLYPLAVAVVLTVTAAAQQPVSPPPAANAPATPETSPAQSSTPPAAKPPQNSGSVNKKGENTGSNAIIELPPTPVLDSEGRQRLDPEGKPMFNPAVRQLRDKKGHPLFDDKGKPVFQSAKDLGYDEKGRKIDGMKEKEAKAVAVTIVHGTFTVDGLTGKAALNYDIKDFRYVYFYVPWIGTTIVSNSPFPGSKEQKDAFSDKTLTVNVGEHTMQLYSEQRLLDKKPQPAFVLVDRDYRLPTRYPVVGYGPSARAPYAWPGSKDDKADAGVSASTPAIPAAMRPLLLLSPCPAGQMRRPSPRPLPGQDAIIQSCVPIAK